MLLDHLHTNTQFLDTIYTHMHAYIWYKHKKEWIWNAAQSVSVTMLQLDITTVNTLIQSGVFCLFCLQNVFVRIFWEHCVHVLLLNLRHQCIWLALVLKIQHLSWVGLAVAVEITVKCHNPEDGEESEQQRDETRRGGEREWINSFSVISQSGRGTKVSTTLIRSSRSSSSSSSFLTSVSVCCHPPDFHLCSCFYDLSRVILYVCLYVSVLTRAWTL